MTLHGGAASQRHVRSVTPSEGVGGQSHVIAGQVIVLIEDGQPVDRSFPQRTHRSIGHRPRLPNLSARNRSAQAPCKIFDHEPPLISGRFC
ncbi:hypothetical protein ACFWPX_29745 [Nocardia sp. NPDC058518]|uniref:hypothetical protein n=1 Tax=Nocardia sp. NPDC058518 TaxID=3346534 RepID=UPI00364D41C8